MKNKLILGFVGASLILTGLVGCSPETSDGPKPSDTAGSAQSLTTIEATDNGTLVKESDANGTVVLKVAPNEGYKLVDILVDGEEKGSAFVKSNYAEGKLTLALSASANHTVKGLFALSTLPDFAFGNGTETNPYKVLTFGDIQKVSFTKDANKTYYFVQNNDIDFALNDDSYEPTLFKGIYDGNGKKITLNKGDSATVTTASLFVVAGDMTIQNLTTVSDTKCALAVFEDMWWHVSSEERMDRNITLKGIDCIAKDESPIQINESNFGFLSNGQIGFKKINLLIDDCSVNVNLSTGEACVGAFLGGFYPGKCDEFDVKIKNSSFTGKLISKSQAGFIGNNAGMSQYLLKEGNTSTLDEQKAATLKEHLKLENVTLDGEISAFDNTGRAVLGLDSAAYSADLAKYYNNQIEISEGKKGFTKATNLLSSSDLSVKLDSSSHKFGITGDDYDATANYVLNFSINRLRMGAESEQITYDGRNISIALDNMNSGTAFASSGIKGNASCGLFTKAEAKEHLPTIFTDDVLKKLNYQYTFLEEFPVALYTKDNLIYFILDNGNSNNLSTYEANDKGELVHKGSIGTISIQSFSQGFLTGFKTL